MILDDQGGHSDFFILIQNLQISKWLGTFLWMQGIIKRLKGILQKCVIRFFPMKNDDDIYGRPLFEQVLSCQQKWANLTFSVMT